MEIGTIKSTDIRDEMQGAYLDYAMSVITARALPDVRDGLKPVQRRILFAMHEMGLRHNLPHKKSARIVGEVLGKLHPHGDTAVYDALVRMAQDFTMRYPLIDGQGNFGSVDNDPAAAMRYTEARLTEIAEEMLLDIDKDTVDFRPNFDESLKEPTVLPAKVPNLLLNGTAGIAVGMATLVPPHNLRETVDAIHYIIDNWNRIDDIEPDDLMQYMKGPDFPTGGIILGIDGIKEAYATGKGRIVVRAKIHTEQVAGGRSRIVVTELPYQVNKAALIERIAELVRERRLEEVGDLRDESDRQGMSVIIELKRGVEPTPVINQLLKHTQLQAGFGLNMLALVEGEPRVLSLKKTLQLYVQHRQIVVTRRTQFELERAKLRAHILEGLKIALDHLDEVIRTIRQSPDADVARERLMKRFKLSELQATAILDMQLRRLAALERKKIEDELAEVLKRIRFLEDVLRSPKKILGVIKDELGDLKERFGDSRRTFIAASTELEFKETTDGEEAESLVAVTRDGSIRRSALSQYRRTRSDAVKGVAAREDDPVEHLFVSNTRDNLVLFTNRGRGLPLRMSQVPDVARNPSGLALRNQMEDRERIVAALPLNEAKFITFATTGGKIKRTAVEELSGLQSGGTRAINLAEGDELGWARVTQGGGELLLVTAQGQALRFKEDDVPVQGRSAAGVWAIKLGEGDRVVALDEADADGTLVLASALGFAKRVAMKEYPVKGRYTFGVSTYTSDNKTGPLVDARVVKPDDDVMFITQNGTVLRIRVDNIAKGNRGARGKSLVDLKGDDIVTELAALVGKIERGEQGGPAESESGGEKETPAALEQAAPAKADGHEPAKRSRKGAAEQEQPKEEKEEPADEPAPKKASKKRVAEPTARAGKRKGEASFKATVAPLPPAPPKHQKSKPEPRAAAKKPAPKPAPPDKPPASRPAPAHAAERAGEKQMDLELGTSFKPLPRKKK
ncbi:MAG: DNA gyrase subunit A [Rudaea sp.]